MGIHSMRVFTATGVAVLDVKGETDRSTVGRHWNAIKAFLGGEVEALEPFRGETVARRRLQTNPDRIEKWAHQGDLDFEDIYAI